MPGLPGLTHPAGELASHHDFFYCDDGEPASHHDHIDCDRDDGELASHHDYILIVIVI